MDWNRYSPHMRLCEQGFELTEQGKLAAARALCDLAYEKATNELEKFIAAYYVARPQQTPAERLQWLEICLQHGQQANHFIVKALTYNVYTEMVKCYQELGDKKNEKKYLALLGK